MNNKENTQKLKQLSNDVKNNISSIDRLIERLNNLTKQIDEVLDGKRD